MLPGFPKTVTTKKIKRGLYTLTRDDGYTVTAQKGVGHWWVNSSRTVPSLKSLRFDLEHGFTAHDQLAAKETQQ